MKHGAEFGRLNHALAELVVVLEELAQTNAFTLHNVLDFLHKGGHVFLVA